MECQKKVCVQKWSRKNELLSHDWVNNISYKSN